MTVFFQLSAMCSQPIKPVNDDHGEDDDDVGHGEDDDDVGDDEEKHPACAASLSGLSPNTS